LTNAAALAAAAAAAHRCATTAVGCSPTLGRKVANLTECKPLQQLYLLYTLCTHGHIAKIASRRLLLLRLVLLRLVLLHSLLLPVLLCSGEEEFTATRRVFAAKPSCKVVRAAAGGARTHKPLGDEEFFLPESPRQPALLHEITDGKLLVLGNWAHNVYVEFMLRIDAPFTIRAAGVVEK
jgi:hypothetical protein